jgi:hypothetical protein
MMLAATSDFQRLMKELWAMVVTEPRPELGSIVEFDGARLGTLAWG